MSLTPKQQEDLRLRQIYRNVFATLCSYDEGKEFVRDLLFNHLMALRNDVKTEGDVAVSNVGRTMLGYIGSVDNSVSADAIIGGLLNTPVYIEKKKETKG